MRRGFDDNIIMSCLVRFFRSSCKFSTYSPFGIFKKCCLAKMIVKYMRGTRCSSLFSWKGLFIHCSILRQISCTKLSTKQKSSTFSVLDSLFYFFRRSSISCQSLENPSFFSTILSSAARRITIAS